MIETGARVYRNDTDIDFSIGDLPVIPVPNALLLVRPSFFEVAYVINPHMEGHIGAVDSETAQAQWTGLAETYRSLGLDIHVLDGRPGLPDMVFCANQTLPAIDSDGQRTVILSQMATAERRDEIRHFEGFFTDRGYEVHAAPEFALEGMGDATWQFDRRLLWVGTGFRTSSRVLDTVSHLLDAKVVQLNLVDPLFYHLDTCLSVLDDRTALWVPEAFDAIGRALLQKLIPRLLAVPYDEAASSLACNAHCPDGHHVLIQAGCRETVRLLRDVHFEVIECETGEFLKAGGSVFCMKQMFWS